MDPNSAAEMHQSLYENMNLGVVFQNSEGAVMEANPAARRILGPNFEKFLRHVSTDQQRPSIHEDGSPFSEEEYPGLQSLRTGKPLHNVIMGVYDPLQSKYSWVRVDTFPLFDEGAPHPKGVINTLELIDRQKQAEEQVIQLSRIYATLSQINQAVVRTKDKESLFDRICEVAVEYGRFDLAWIALADEPQQTIKAVTLSSSDQKNTLTLHALNLALKKQMREMDEVFKKCEVTTCDIDHLSAPDHPLQKIAFKAGCLSMAVIPFISNGRCIGVLVLCSHEKELFKSAKELQLLEETGMDISYALLSLEVEADKIKFLENLKTNQRVLQLLVENTPAAIAMFDCDMKYLAASKRFFKDYRISETEIIGRSHYEIFPEISQAVKDIHQRCLGGAVEKADQDAFHRLDGSVDWVRWEIFPWYEQENKIGGIILFSEVITDQVYMINDLIATRAKMEAAFDSMNDAVFVSDLEGNFIDFNEAFATFHKFSDKKACAKTLAEYPDIIDVYKADGEPAPLSEWAVPRALRGEIGNSVEYTLRRKDTGQIWEGSYSFAPIRDKDGKITGSVVIARDITEHKAIEEKIHRQIERLSALRSIDTAISSSFDLQVILNVLLEHVLSQLDVDAAVVLLFESATKELVYAAGRGFRTAGITHLRLKIGEDYAGEAALNRRTVSIMNLNEAKHPLSKGVLTAGEDFVSFYAVPLIAKGKVNGVLEIFNRSSLNPKPDWLDYLETLAGQAAIAIDSGQLFDGLQRKNNDLISAYDATITGWSKALDLRDKETEGHTQRVTDMTIDLARLAGVPRENLVHIRRGALLHDIGKLGVPDYILLKPDKLTDEEWVIMRRHPQYAYELLEPIEYLRSALNIPYCHHEKWDGSGYPRGLKGDQIPFEARLFAVVDVWDALCSDRPYRDGWLEGRVLEYLESQSGTHFDPRAVKLFLQLKNQIKN